MKDISVLLVTLPQYCPGGQIRAHLFLVAQWALVPPAFSERMKDHLVDSMSSSNFQDGQPEIVVAWGCGTVGVRAGAGTGC